MCPLDGSAISRGGGLYVSIATSGPCLMLLWFHRGRLLLLIIIIIGCLRVVRSDVYAIKPESAMVILDSVRSA